MSRFFLFLYYKIQNRKLIFGFLLLLIFGLLAWSASHIKFDEDISKLIPVNSENDQLQKVLKNTQFADKIIVHIQKDKNGSPDDLTDYGEAFLEKLSENSTGYYNAVQGKIEESSIFETLDFVYQHVPLFLTSEDYKVISAKLQPDSLAKITAQNYKTIISPTGIIAKKTLLDDPLGISFLAVKHLQQLGFSDDFSLKDGFVVSKDGLHLLLFISPAYPSNNTSKNAVFAEQLHQIQQDLNKHFHDKVKTSYYGGPLIAVANAAQIKKDIQLTVTIAMVLLMAVFIVFYKKLTVPVILFVPTLFGGLLAISILSLIRSEISAISLGVGAVLLGVTLDYSLHVLTHIRNNEKVQELFNSVSKPILMSSLTTAMAFFCLLFVDSQALQDLGIFAAISVIGSSVFALIFIPQAYKVKDHQALQKSVFDRLANYPYQKNKILVIGIVALLILSAFTYHRVSFNKDISKLNYQPESIIKAEASLDQLLHLSTKSLYIIAFGENQQQVLETNDLIFDKLKTLENQNLISDYNSVGALVSSDKKQKKAIHIWNDFWTPHLKADTQSLLIKYGSQLGFKPTSFQRFYDLPNQDFQPVSVEAFKKINVIPIDDFINQTPDFTTISSIVKVDDKNIETVKTAFKNIPHTMVIDRQAINETLLGDLKNDFNNLLVYCFIAVLLLLFAFYRNLKVTVVTVVPIIITWFVTIGIMGAFHLEFNIFNIIISTFIFGLGVDYSIFMTNGMRSGTSSMATHKTSIILSVLTTIMGVGVLIFTKHPALHSLATISIIGIFAAMLISFVVQPILYRWLISDSSGKD